MAERHDVTKSCRRSSTAHTAGRNRMEQQCGRETTAATGGLTCPPEQLYPVQVVVHWHWGAEILAYPRLRQVVWLCAALPTVAAADPDFPGIRSTFNDHSFKLDFSAGEIMLDWHPYGGGFFGAAALLRQTSGVIDAAAPRFPSSHLSLKPLAPYLGTYLGVGWKSAPSNRKFAWMVDLGVVCETTPTVALNVSSNITESHSTSGVNTPATSYRFSPRGRFSFSMNF